MGEGDLLLSFLLCRDLESDLDLRLGLSLDDLRDDLLSLRSLDLDLLLLCLVFLLLLLLSLLPDLDLLLR